MHLQKTDRPVFFLLLFVSAILIAGLCFTVSSDMQRAQWPSATAKIVDHGSWAVQFRRPFYYTSSVEYKYTVGGKKYRSSDIDDVFGSPVFFDSASARKYAAEHYPIGGAIAVHYNPLDFSFAVVHLGIQRLEVYPAFLIGFFLFLAGYIFYSSSKIVEKTR